LQLKENETTVNIAVILHKRGEKENAIIELFVMESYC